LSKSLAASCHDHSLAAHEKRPRWAAVLPGR